MPKLLAFLPCDQAIISKEDDTVTLITVTPGFTVSVPQDALGKNVLLPHRWTVFSYWLKESGDDDVEFEQRLEYISPNNAPLVNLISQFVISKATHSIVGRIAAPPLQSAKIGPVDYRLRLSIRRVGEREYRTVSEFPFTVTIDVASPEVVSQK